MNIITIHNLKTISKSNSNGWIIKTYFNGYRELFIFTKFGWYFNLRKLFNFIFNV